MTPEQVAAIGAAVAAGKLPAEAMHWVTDGRGGPLLVPAGDAEAAAPTLERIRIPWRTLPATPEATSRGSERPQERRKAPGGPVGPPEPAATPAPAAEAQRAALSSSSGEAPERPRSAVARSRSAAAWAQSEPAAVWALIRSNTAAVLERLAPDAGDSANGHELRDLFAEFAEGDPLLAEIEQYAKTLPPKIRDPYRAALGKVREEREAMRERLLYLLERLPSCETDKAGEPLSLLAAAREALGTDERPVGMIPPAPAVHVVEVPEDREEDTLPTQDPDAEQLILPAMAPAWERAGPVGPAPWLGLFDRLGGESMAAGVGAPPELRLFVECLAWAPPAARRGHEVEIRPTVRDLRDALWPDGWRRGEQLPRLIAACQSINGLGWISIPERRTRFAPVLFREWPDLGAILDDPLSVKVQIPPVLGAGAGARFDRSTLRRLGLRSAPEYRAYLGLVHWWDRRSRRGVRPWSPTGAPADWPGLDPAERRRLIFGPDEAVKSRTTLRTRLARADRAFQALADSGVIALEEAGRGGIWIPERRDLPRN